MVDDAVVKKLKSGSTQGDEVAVKAFVSDDIEYMTADEEEEHMIAQANVAAATRMASSSKPGLPSAGIATTSLSSRPNASPTWTSRPGSWFRWLRP